MNDKETGDIGVGSWIERRARLAPGRPAVISGARTFTYGELAERIRRVANGLRGLGVGRGDRVAWLGANHPAFLETLFAAGQLGAVLAPVNHRLERAVQAAVLSLTEPVVLVQHAIAEPVVAPSVRYRIVVGGAYARSDADDVLDYEALVAGSPGDPVYASVALPDLFMLPHTSGTTGSPKAVMLSHGNVTWNAINLLSRADIRGDDVTIAIAPFFRVGGTGVNVLPVLFAGGTVVVPDDSTPGGLLRLMEGHRVTVGFGNPDVLEALSRADRWPLADLSTLRFVITGGAPVPERLIRSYVDRGVTLLQGYGLSEAAPVVLLLDAVRALEKIGAAGKPPLFVDIRITDPAGVDLPGGQNGELLVRGPNVMAGYWRDPGATAAALIEGGWLRTGDAARVDDDGDVWIVDRLADRFVSAGQVVFPGDVERALLAHPAVADAGVVGVPRTHGGSVSAAFVVLHEGSLATEDDLLSFCGARLMTSQVPASVTFIATLPRNAVGKLMRHELLGLAAPGSASLRGSDGEPMPHAPTSGIP